jgi:anti-sigma factor RsiW
VETAWAEAAESLELGFDIRRLPAETRTEFAGRLETDRRVPSEQLTTLAETATVARFHPEGVDEGRADQSDQLAQRIETAMKNRVPIYTRLRRQLDPRRLFKPTKRIVTETTTRSVSAVDEQRELVDSNV